MVDLHKTRDGTWYPSAPRYPFALSSFRPINTFTWIINIDS